MLSYPSEAAFSLGCDRFHATVKDLMRWGGNPGISDHSVLRYLINSSAKLHHAPCSPTPRSAGNRLSCILPSTWEHRQVQAHINVEEPQRRGLSWLRKLGTGSAEAAAALVALKRGLEELQARPLLLRLRALALSLWLFVRRFLPAVSSSTESSSAALRGFTSAARRQGFRLCPCVRSFRPTHPVLEAHDHHHTVGSLEIICFLTPVARKLKKFVSSRR